MGWDRRHGRAGCKLTAGTFQSSCKPPSPHCPSGMWSWAYGEWPLGSPSSHRYEEPTSHLVIYTVPLDLFLVRCPRHLGEARGPPRQERGAARPHCQGHGAGPWQLGSHTRSVGGGRLLTRALTPWLWSIHCEEFLVQRRNSHELMFLSRGLCRLTQSPGSPGHSNSISTITKGSPRPPGACVPVG